LVLIKASGILIEALASRVGIESSAVNVGAHTSGACAVGVHTAVNAKIPSAEANIGAGPDARSKRQSRLEGSTEAVRSPEGAANTSARASANTRARTDAPSAASYPGNSAASAHGATDVAARTA
jgi:hypothetical protein